MSADCCHWNGGAATNHATDTPAPVRNEMRAPDRIRAATAWTALVPAIGPCGVGEGVCGRSGLFNLFVSRFYYQKLALRTKTLNKSRLSKMAGKALQKAKMYQYSSQPIDSRTKNDRAIAPPA